MPVMRVRPRSMRPSRIVIIVALAALIVAVAARVLSVW
jgi:hypothetical protein